MKIVIGDYELKITKKKYNYIINRIVKLQFAGYNYEELKILKIEKTNEKEAKVFFVNNAVLFTTIIWAIYAVLVNIISKNNETICYFKWRVTINIIITISFFIYSLYIYCKIKKFNREIGAIAYLLEYYNKFC